MKQFTQLLIYVLTFLSSFVWGQNTSPFLKTYELGEYGLISDIIETDDLGYVLIGKSSTSTLISGNWITADSLRILKTDVNGNLVWSKKINNYYCSEGSFLIKSNNGNLFIVGFGKKLQTNPYNVFLLKIDSLGNLLWEKTISHQTSMLPKSATSTRDGGILLSLSVSASLTENIIVKLDSLGNEVFSSGINLPRSYTPKIIETADMGFLINCDTGNYSTQQGGMAWVSKIDSNGVFVWSKAFSSSGNVSTIDIIEDSSQNIVLALNVSEYDTISNTNFSQVFSLLKLNSLGDTLWMKNYFPLGERGKILSTSNQDYVIAMATAYGFPSLILKTNTNGNLLWYKKYQHPSTGYPIALYFTSSIINNSNSIVVVGQSINALSPQFNGGFLMKTDSNGYISCRGEVDSLFSPLVESFDYSNDSINFIQDTLIYSNNVLIENAITFSYTICETVGIEDLSDQEVVLMVYPNPASSDLTIAYKPETKKAVVEIYNSIGQQVKQIALLDENQQITIADLTYGLYILKLNDGKNSATQRFVKQ